jgi:ribose 5-phosphate isomerase B
MKIFIGADHQGFHLKANIISYLAKHDHAAVDKGNNRLDPADNFTDFARPVVSAVLTSDDAESRGILICGSGQGMCMFANRFKGIRAALVWSEEEARLSRNDDDSNVLCLPARLISEGKAENIVQTWLDTPFAGAERFKRRLASIDKFGS